MGQAGRGDATDGSDDVELAQRAELEQRLAQVLLADVLLHALDVALRVVDGEHRVEVLEPLGRLRAFARRGATRRRLSLPGRTRGRRRGRW